MKLGLYFIAAHIVAFTNCWSISYFNCNEDDLADITAYACNTPENISSASADFKETLLRLPRNISVLTEDLKINGFVENETYFVNRLPVEIDDIDMFTRLPSLESLTIIARKLEIREKSNLFDQIDLLKKGLFDLTNLKSLQVSLVEPTFEPNTKLQWVLPKNLKYFIVEGILEEFDLSECFKLEVLSVRLCNSSNLPPLHKPAPPIRLFRFDGCPLNELIVDDIAEFCLLKYLFISSLEEPYNVNIDGCECFWLRNWIDRLSGWNVLNFTGELPCDNRTTVTELCPNNNLDSAMRLRKKCLGRSEIFIFYLAVAMIVLPVVFICLATFRWYKKVYGSQPKSGNSTVTSDAENDS